MTTPRNADGSAKTVTIHLSKREARALMVLLVCQPGQPNAAACAVFDRLAQAVRTYERHEQEQLSNPSGGNPPASNPERKCGNEATDSPCGGEARTIFAP